MNTFFREKNIIKFVANTVIVALPVLLFLVFFEIIAIRSGELTPVKNVIKYQQQNGGLYGRSVTDQDLRKYKYLYLSSLEPKDVLVLGSSRVLQFREKMFSPEYSFYNLGSIAHSVLDLYELSLLWPKEQNPKVLILGLDYYWFTDVSDKRKTLAENLEEKDKAYDFGSSIFSVRYLVKNLLKDSNSLNKFIEVNDSFSNLPAYGFQAKSGNGFRSDGSYQYGSYISLMRENPDLTYVDREQPPIIDRIRLGVDSYQFDTKIDMDKIELLRKVILSFKDKNIKIIGLMMPFSPESYEELSTNPRHKKSFEDIRLALSKLFDEEKITFFDYSDPDKLKISDKYFFDGLHISEPGAMIILSDILKNIPKNTLEYSNSVHLRIKEVLMKKQKSTWEVGW